MQVLRHIWKQAPALVLLLLFVSGWLAAPLALAAPEQITCGMVCCEESGECCCFVSRQAHYHEEKTADDETQLLVFRNGCPSDCARPPAFSNQSFQQKSLPSLLRLEFSEPDEPPAQQWRNPVQFHLTRQSAPRAPPLIS